MIFRSLLKFPLAMRCLTILTALGAPTLAADKPNVLVIWGDDIGANPKSSGKLVEALEAAPESGC